MNLPKAIEILELNLKENSSTMPGDCYDAVQLSVEAMLYVERTRLGADIDLEALLPGETKG